jgi:predicted MPP superfamily phosphohydrolase
LVGLKILQVSDLHWNSQFSSSLQKKLIRKANALKPDLILFTGDFICRSKLENCEGLKQILNALNAKLGCFAVFGNHDYARFVTVSAKGDYDVEAPSSSSNITKGFKRLFQPVVLTKRVSEQAAQVGQNKELLALLKETPFRLLNNMTEQVTYHGVSINICGLEEYSLGRFDPSQAFRNYDQRYPGIVLSHNPDTLAILKDYPGDIILSGHTHGGQVNLPGLWPRFTRIENLQFKSGLKRVGDKWAYINRGISSVMKFRWFAAPELTLLTLQKG